MKVEIFLENDLWRSANNYSKKHLRIFSYDDTVSKSHREATDRAWLVTNGAIMRLNEDDLSLRQKWEALVPGLTVSVNDVVSVDSVAYRCVPGGWQKI